MTRIIFCLFCLLAAISSQAQLLWKITGPNVKTTSYILGSHHVAPASMIDSIPGLVAAIESCDAVYGEVKKDALTSPEAQQQMMMKAMAPADSTLDKVLTPEQFKRLDDLLASYTGMPGVAQQLIPFSPAIVSSQLAVLMAAKAFPGFDPSNVFDVAIMGLGEKLNKSIDGFETLDDQLNILFGSPISEQAKDLMETVDKEEEMIAYSQRMAQAYLEQDLNALQSLMEDEDLGLSEAEWNKLIYNRNAHWVSQLQLLLPMRNMFIVVGSGHLPGDKGVLQLLRNLGYQVTPVSE